MPFFISYVLPHVKRVTSIRAAPPVISCLHYVNVLFAFLMLVKRWMTEIIFPDLKGVSLIAAYFAQHYSAFIIGFKPTTSCSHLSTNLAQSCVFLEVVVVYQKLLRVLASLTF